MRLVFVLLAAAAGCGRIGFDATGRGDATGVPDDVGPPPEVMPAPGLACGETVTTDAAPVAGTALATVVTRRGLAALWIGPGGALFGTTWSAAPGGAAVVEDAIAIATGPFTQLWAAPNDDQILVAALDGAGVTVRILRGDLTPALPSLSLGAAPLGGRAPFTRKRGGTGFLAITQGGEQPAIFEIPPPSPGMARLLTELRFHAAASIAADTDGYVVVTELADGFGPGCWVSKFSDTFALVGGPGTLESTQQADCDSSTAVASAGASGAAMAWMDRDPVNSYAEFRGSGGSAGTASMSGEIGVGLPTVAATSTGLTALYRSPAGVRVFDQAGTRTLAPASALADLVTWADQAIVVWTAASGAVRLTRLCPP